jgi:hypothetical protein
MNKAREIGASILRKRPSMTDNRNIDHNDETPETREPPDPNAMEQAQKDAAEQRLVEGGYNG